MMVLLVFIENAGNIIIFRVKVLYFILSVIHDFQYEWIISCETYAKIPNIIKTEI